LGQAAHIDWGAGANNPLTGLYLAAAPGQLTPCGVHRGVKSDAGISAHLSLQHGSGFSNDQKTTAALCKS
jgi:hypothetical protein